MEVESRHYPNAPITEAILDIRVAPRSDLALPLIEEVAIAEQEGYPNRELTFEAVGMVQVKLGVSAEASAKQRQTGFKFSSNDGKNIWQSRLDGFTFSRLAPYQEWASFSGEARRLWSIYRQTTCPDAITRLAVRYINRIDIPAGQIDLKDYFRTSPEISADLPQQLGGFFMHVIFPEVELGGQTILNQTIVEPAGPDTVSIVLDIDIFRSERVAQDEDAVWSYFDQLRLRKNAIFNACITERTKELFA